MIVADSFIALLSALLAVLFWTESLQIWHVYVIMFLRALGGAFHSPAMQASTSLMVPRDQLTRVGGMNQTLSGIMAIDVITAAFAIGPLCFVHIPQPERKAHAYVAAKPSVWRDVVDGFHYLWDWKGMFLVLMLATLINMAITPGMSLLPVLVQKHFRGGAVQLGWMNSAWGIGVIAGGVILSAWGGFKSKILTSMLGLIGMGLGLAIVGLSPAHAFWLSIAGLALGGTMNPIVNGPFMALFQQVVAPELQGRVFTVLQSMAALATPLGLAIAGPLSDWLGVQVWFVAGGLVCAVAGVAILLTPAVMHIESHGHALQAARDATAE